MRATIAELLERYRRAEYTAQTCIGNTLARNCGGQMTDIQLELDARYSEVMKAVERIMAIISQTPIDRHRRLGQLLCRIPAIQEFTKVT